MVIVTPFQRKKKQRYLVLIIIIALLGTIFIVWYKFLPKQSSVSRSLPEKPPRIDINFNILKDPILTNETGLKSFEGIPPFNPIDAGRSNPFQPY
jgi:hypothetical protein